MSEPTRPIKPAPEWVGEGDSRKDISIMGDRGIAVMALDAVLRLSDTIKRHSDEFREFLDSDAKTKMILLQEIPNHAARITALEVAMQESRYKSAMIPVIAEEEREERPSKHEWDEILAKAGEELSKRVKDPKDRIDSIRARQIAMEEGLKFVYTGNIANPDGEATYCPGSKEKAIVRQGYFVIANNLKDGACHDGEKIPGIWR